MVVIVLLYWKDVRRYKSHAVEDGKVENMEPNAKYNYQLKMKPCP